MSHDVSDNTHSVENLKLPIKMSKLNNRVLRFIVILTAIGFVVEAGMYKKDNSTAYISYYTKETGFPEQDFCLLKCNLKESCVGVAVENVGQKVDCYFVGVSRSHSKGLTPSSQIQHWIKGKEQDNLKQYSQHDKSDFP